MTTFTLQDLNQNLTNEEFEAMQALAKLGGGIDLGELFKQMGKDLADQTIQEAHETQARLGEVLPKPSQISPEKVIDEMVSQFAISLRLLLTTVISSQPKQNTTPPEGNQSLQDCVALTLQQADWFKEMVGACIDEDMVIEGVKDCVEREVECYFDYRFDVNKHFDFNEAIHDAVSDQIDSVVSDQIDDKLEEVVAEKLSEASISINF